MTTSDDRLFRQLLDNIAQIERDLGRVRTVIERRLRGPQSQRRRPETPRRYHRSHYVRRQQAPEAVAQVIPPPPPMRTVAALPPSSTQQPRQIADEIDTEIEAVLIRSFEEARVAQRLSNSIQNVRIPKLKTKALKASEINLPLTDSCVICQETHIKCDSIETSCGHHFGQTCFLDWVRTKKQSHQDLCCPLCMRNKPDYHGFRARKPPVNRDRVINAST